MAAFRWKWTENTFFHSAANCYYSGLNIVITISIIHWANSEFSITMHEFASLLSSPVLFYWNRRPTTIDDESMTKKTMIFNFVDTFVGRIWILPLIERSETHTQTLRISHQQSNRLTVCAELGRPVQRRRRWSARFVVTARGCQKCVHRCVCVCAAAVCANRRVYIATNICTWTVDFKVVACVSVWFLSF